MSNIAYVRVSTIDQNEERQLKALEIYDIDKWFTEKISGKNTNRPELQRMLEYVREGDTVYVHDFSRLARSTKDLLQLVEDLQQKGVHLVSSKENMDTSTATGKLMITMMAAIAEFERANLLERQKEGIAIARNKGIYRGRKTIEINERFISLYHQYQMHQISKSKFAMQYGVSRPTLNKLLWEHEKKAAD